MKAKKKYFRERVGFSQNDLAKEMNVGQNTISLFENNKWKPTLNFLKEYQTQLKLSKEEFEEILFYELEVL